MNHGLRKSLAGIVLAGLAGAAWAAGDPEAGKEVYKANRCQMCHQIGGQGGKMGGALDDVGSKRDTGWLHQFIKNPKAVDEKAKMKAYPDLSAKELDDLVAYLLSLKAVPDKK